jgi:hypothetical protein
VSLFIWPATGRWRVRQYVAPYGGPAGTPQLRYGVIDPSGRHWGSSTSWSVAQAAAVEMAQAMAREP